MASGTLIKVVASITGKKAKNKIIKTMTDLRYVPYAMLHTSPVIIYFCQIPITLRLTGQHTATVSVPAAFRLLQADSEEFKFQHTQTQTVSAGTCFTLEYKGEECEVRVGRRIMAVDGDEHILL